MNPKDWNEGMASACALMLMTDTETKSQAVLATLEFCLELSKAHCDLEKFRPLLEAHAIACKQQLQSN